MAIGAAALTLVGCGSAASSRRAAWPTWQDRAGRVAVGVPPGWSATNRPLTALGSPVQRLAVASFPLRGVARDPSCGPRSAVHAMPAGGAFAFLFEYEGPTRRDVAREPARPAHFALTKRAFGRYECMGPSYLLRFTDHGRALQAHVYFGRRASAATRRRMLRVLDSLRFGAPSPAMAAVWRAPHALLRRAPYLGVACPQPNRFACDRVGLAVWLRAPALRVSATVDGRRLVLDDQRWSGPRAGRRMFAGFLHPAGLLRGPLALRADDGRGRWVGRHPKRAGVGLWIEDRPGHVVRTSLVVALAAGWG